MQQNGRSSDIIRFALFAGILVTVLSSPPNIGNGNYIYDPNSISQNEKILKLFIRLAAHTANRLIRLKTQSSPPNAVRYEDDVEIGNDSSEDERTVSAIPGELDKEGLESVDYNDEMQSADEQIPAHRIMDEGGRRSEESEEQDRPKKKDESQDYQIYINQLNENAEMLDDESSDDLVTDGIETTTEKQREFRNHENLERRGEVNITEAPSASEDPMVYHREPYLADEEVEDEEIPDEITTSINGEIGTPDSGVEVENRALFNIEKNNYVTHYTDKSTNINRADTTVNNHGGGGGGRGSGNVIVNQEAGSKPSGIDKLLFWKKKDSESNNFGNSKQGSSSSNVVVNQEAGSSGSLGIANVDESKNFNEAKTNLENSFGNGFGNVEINQAAGSKGNIVELDESMNVNHAVTMIGHSGSGSNDNSEDSSASSALEKNFEANLNRENTEMGKISTSGNDERYKLAAAGISASDSGGVSAQVGASVGFAGDKKIKEPVQSGIQIRKEVTLELMPSERNASLNSKSENIEAAEQGKANFHELAGTLGKESLIKNSGNFGSNFEGGFYSGSNNENGKLLRGELNGQESDSQQYNHEQELIAENKRQHELKNFSSFYGAAEQGRANFHELGTSGKESLIQNLGNFGSNVEGGFYSGSKNENGKLLRGELNGQESNSQQYNHEQELIAENKRQHELKSFSSSHDTEHNLVAAKASYNEQTHQASTNLAKSAHVLSSSNTLSKEITKQNSGIGSAVDIGGNLGLNLEHGVQRLNSGQNRSEGKLENIEQGSISTGANIQAGGKLKFEVNKGLSAGIGLINEKMNLVRGAVNSKAVNFDGKLNVAAHVLAS